MSIAVVQDEQGVTISVRDNGAGIPADVLPRIFEAFYTTKGSRSTGLGLACCEKIIAQHGGRMDVQSTPGEGAEFFVFLPFVRREGKATQNLTLLRNPGK